MLLKETEGNFLPSFLSNFAPEKVVRDAELDIRGTIYTKTVQLMAYANNLVITARTVNASEETFMAEKSAKKMGLTINDEKTKFM